jgi:hypothetical protein
LALVDCIAHPELLSWRAALRLLRFFRLLAQSIPPFDEFAIPEQPVRSALVGSPTLDAAAPIESAAAVTAAALIVAVVSLLFLSALPAGA